MVSRSPVKLPVPTEDDEQIVFVQWLELMGLKFTHIPNSTYTTSWTQKAHNRSLGLRAGFPDLIVLVDPTRSIDGRGYLLCPEMKRTKGSVTSEEQKRWIAALNGLDNPHVQAQVCYGADEAIFFVSSYLSSALLQRSPF